MAARVASTFYKLFVACDPIRYIYLACAISSLYELVAGDPIRAIFMACIVLMILHYVKPARNHILWLHKKHNERDNTIVEIIGNQNHIFRLYGRLNESNNVILTILGKQFTVQRWLNNLERPVPIPANKPTNRNSSIAINNNPSRPHPLQPQSQPLDPRYPSPQAG
ncbi:hypothetical protein F4782DRAFT_535254 [Xylaria castorea]|nr:hypothetical protein F4782DRAFT_535254 [Xylaria castorea]